MVQHKNYQSPNMSDVQGIIREFWALDYEKMIDAASAKLAKGEVTPAEYLEEVLSQGDALREAAQAAIQQAAMQQAAMQQAVSNEAVLG